MQQMTTGQRTVLRNDAYNILNIIYLPESASIYAGIIN